MRTISERANIINIMIIQIFIAALFLVGKTAMAQEHPGKPMSEAPGMQKSSVTIESLASAISDYVKKETDLKGGYFLFYDDEQDKPLALTLEDVHNDRLGAIGNDVYFACADFESTDGDMYDIDIFMKNTDSGFDVTDISVHKMNGEARYDWVEEDGIWKKKSL
jgi:hypothetical protein